MQIMSINKNKRKFEACLTKEEIIIIIKAFVYIGIGLLTDEFEIFYNVEKETVDKLSGEFRKTRGILSRTASNNDKENQMLIKKYDSQKKLLNIELDELHRKAISGALSHACIWVYEEDCSSLLGVSWDDFLKVRTNILLLLRETNNLEVGAPGDNSPGSVTGTRRGRT
jgi:hypothetical protein